MKPPAPTATIFRLLALTFFCFAILVGAEAKSKGGSSGGSVHVKGYTRKDGTYVAPHYRSAPNSTKSDNWSTKGNVNPYTGKVGTKKDDAAPDSSPSTTTPSTKLQDRSEVASSGWAGIKSGLTNEELTRQLGIPSEVVKSPNHDTWVYPNGKVFLKDGKVVAWVNGGVK